MVNSNARIIQNKIVGLSDFDTTIDVTSGGGTVYPSRAPESPRQLLVWFMLLDLLFYVYVLYIVVCPFVRLFRLTIVLSVLLRFKDSDYPFGIFKLFLTDVS